MREVYTISSVGRLLLLLLLMGEFDAAVIVVAVAVLCGILCCGLVFWGMEESVQYQAVVLPLMSSVGGLVCVCALLQKLQYVVTSFLEG